MSLFGLKLSELEHHLFKNTQRTRSAFSEETRAIENGLAMMVDLTNDVNEAIRKKAEPNIYANMRLFARNRQLLLNAYFCMLCSNYGTQFVILRTVLENNNLMRLFNLHPEYAYEWLSSEKQRQFPSQVQAKYGRSTRKNREFKDLRVRAQLFREIKKEKVAKEIKEIYGQLCDYTHPNFKGWHEVMGLHGNEEVLLRMPAFVGDNAIEAVKLSLWLMQLSFKTMVETSRVFISDFGVDLDRWQRTCNKLMVKYTD